MKRCEKPGAMRSSFQTLSAKLISYTRARPGESKWLTQAPDPSRSRRYGAVDVKCRTGVVGLGVDKLESERGRQTVE